MPEPGRVVEVLGASEGSGYLIGPRLILTAWHVIDGQSLQTPIEVRLLRDYVASRPEDRLQTRTARLIWPSQPGNDNELDFALLVLDDPADSSDRPVHWAELTGWGRTTVDALGFPDAAIFQNRDLEAVGYQPFDERDTIPIRGYVLPGAGLKAHEAYDHGTFDIILPDEDLLSESVLDWEGMSGAAVFAGPDLVGIVQAASEVRSLHRLKALPVERLFRRTDVTEAIHEAGLAAPPRRNRLRAYDTVGTEPFAASERTFKAAAAKPFYGRAKDIEALDGFLVEQDRGVLLLRSEPGLGKTRLAVEWARHSAAAPATIVLRHAFSVREPKAADHAAMVESLARQAAAALGPEALGVGDPGDARRLDSRLATLLGTDQPEQSRLVLVLDALDEAAEPIEPWSTRMGRGVFLLLTCRAEAGEEPRVLRVWREHSADANLSLIVHPLQPLDKLAIAEWLSAATGKTMALTDPLVASATRASEGVPLFASFLIPDAIEPLNAGVADPFPKTFNDYALRQLEGLKDHVTGKGRAGSWTWENTLDLFAVLSVTRAPLLPTVLRRLIGTPRFDELDQRVERWLWQHADAEGAVSFAHPRLASVFGAVLPERPYYVDVATMEDRLIDACAIAWKAASDLKVYALAWLPTHLQRRERTDEAAELLGDTAFLVARLKTSPTVAMVRNAASETISLDLRLAGSHSALAAWRRFWSETEAQFATGMERADSLRLTATGLLAQLAGDRFSEQEAAALQLSEKLPKRNPAAPHLARACGFRHPTLLRSVDAHRGGVGGMLAMHARLVSWGLDGAIRLWSRDGTPLPGGDPDAHKNGVGGMLAMDEQLVSWGLDGAIRVWSRDGTSLPGGVPNAQGAIVGVLAIDERLIGWSLDGAIRLWSRDGTPLPGGDPDAHRGPVLGMLAMHARLVSWGLDGAIRQWSRDGTPLPGGVPNAHGGHIVQGMLTVDERLVSWGTDGAIRLWNRDGTPLPGGVPDPHKGQIQGVLATDERLVSWGSDGAIRQWSRDGTPLPGGAPNAHRGPVRGVLAMDERLVSWGQDGAIRQWSRDGTPLPGGVPNAHEGWVQGVLAIDERLVSWGPDGAIRQWGRDGTSLACDVPNTPEGWVRGMLAMDERLVSWGLDGAIRLWSHDGTPLPGGVPNAHEGGVGGMLTVDERLVSWGTDGAIRLWNRDGTPLPGGSANAHDGQVLGVLAVDERLVSWGQDGAIRLWSHDGTPLPGGDPNAHRAAVLGVLAMDERLVSWGQDGAIRLWSHDGTPLPGGVPDADGYFFQGVLAMDERLVSWGLGGAIRMWALDGTPLSGGVSNAHEGWVQGVLAMDERLVSWGPDGAIRQWSRDGMPLPGGSANAHDGQVLGVLALDERLVSWGQDGVIRLWNRHMQRDGLAWIAPTRLLETAKVIDSELWVGFQGTPYRIIFGESKVEPETPPEASRSSTRP